MNNIKLLDGTIVNRGEALDNMTSDGYYYEFLNVNRCLSYSTMKTLLVSPKLFDWKTRNPQKGTQALRDGRLVHTEILEPNKYDETFKFVDTSTKSTKKYKLAEEKHGKDNTFTLKEKYMANRIASAFLQNDACTVFLQGSEVEVPELATINNIPIRAKADILNISKSFVADIKTTSDGLKEVRNRKTGEVTNQFRYTIEKYDYDLQAALYREIYGVNDFYWLVIDKTTTDIGVFKASDETIESGMNKLDACLAIYDSFFIDGLIDLSQYHKSETI